VRWALDQRARTNLNSEIMGRTVRDALGIFSWIESGSDGTREHKRQNKTQSAEHGHSAESNPIDEYKLYKS
jgi:hypothetical protein